MQHPLTAIGTDPDALEAFYREHVEAVQRFVARRVTDPHVAADLTADVFLEAIEACARYRPDLGAPRAWLYGVARNVLAMHVRRGVREARAVGRIQGRRLLDPDSVQRIVERIDAERDARELLTALDDMTSTLDSFETALLAELRAVVATRGPEQRPTPRPKWNRRWVLAPVGIAAAAATALAVVPGIGPEPAYAVTEGNDGEVHVRVDRIEDAEGLERALEDHGIGADVTYLADNLVCAEGRYRDAPPPPRGAEMTFSMGSGGYTVDLAPGTVQDDETIVISIARRTDLEPGMSGGITGSIGVAVGPVATCEPVPAPPLPTER